MTAAAAAAAGALALAVLGATGCDDGGGGEPGGEEPDAGAGPCLGAPGPDLAPPWLPELIDDVVARLSGARPLRPGVVLGERASEPARAEARALVAGRLAEVGLEPREQAYGGGGVNVYAELDPTVASDDGWLVLGAHLDGVPGSPAANDNATGVALVVAVARALAGLECRARGVVVVLFDEEELGLIGSTAFVELLLADGRPIAEVHTVDQVGWDADGDRAVELERPTPALAARYEAAVRDHGLAIPLAATAIAASDHEAFRSRGLSAVGVTEEYVGGDTTPHYHAPGDTHATVELAYLASVTGLVLAVVGDHALGAVP